MKKAALFILVGVVLLVAVVAGWLGWTVKQEAPKSGIDKAREGKAKLKELRLEAELLGIDHFGKSAKALEQEIQNFKSQDNGEDENNSDSTEEETKLD